MNKGHDAPPKLFKHHTQGLGLDYLECDAAELFSLLVIWKILHVPYVLHGISDDDSYFQIAFG